MPKNLILIHLESISNTILWQYRLELKTVWQIMQQSFVYNRFYTTSTSTEMSLENLFHGDSSTFDSSSVFSDKQMLVHNPSYFGDKVNTLRAALFFEGYLHPDRLNSVWEIPDRPELVHAKGSITARNQEEWYPVVRARMAEHRISGRPFFLHFISGVTHITYEDQVKASATSFSDRFRLGYLRLDSGIARLLSILNEFNLLSNSVLVFYGDHGDELWSHGLNKGWCHATTPYASQCWTPLFIYDPDAPPGSTDQLASMVDVRQTLVKRLFPAFSPEQHALTDRWTNRFGDVFMPGGMPLGYPRSGVLPPFKTTPFSGVDLASETRELAFSQALYGLQLEFNDIAKALTKGYAVTDGTYRVTVTSGGEDGRDGGVEFFCDMIDPTNSRNLLNFFKLDLNGDIREFYPPPQAVNEDFSLVFNAECIKHLTLTFHRLKNALHEYVRDKEEFAKKHNHGNIHVMPEGAFRHALKRPFKD